MKMKRNAKLLLIINTIRKIIDIFLGPFLTAYLFRVAIDNIKIISIYNIFSYIVIAIISIIIGEDGSVSKRAAKRIWNPEGINLSLLSSGG